METFAHVVDIVGIIIAIIFVIFKITEMDESDVVLLIIIAGLALIAWSDGKYGDLIFYIGIPVAVIVYILRRI